MARRVSIAEEGQQGGGQDHRTEGDVTSRKGGRGSRQEESCEEEILEKAKAGQKSFEKAQSLQIQIEIEESSEKKNEESEEIDSRLF